MDSESAGQTTDGASTRTEKPNPTREEDERHCSREYLKGPDLDKDGFCLRNAFFFAHMSWNAYRDKEVCDERFKKIGMDEFYWFANDHSEDSMWDDIMDTQGAVGAGEKYIVVVFRGTKEGADWVTNLKFVQSEFPGLGRVHKGFVEGLDTVWQGEDGMAETVKRLHAESPRPVYVAGHSLGAALATIAAARMAIDFGFHIAALYTIGSPRVFDTEAAENFDAHDNFGVLMKEKSYRAVNNNDIVTCIPPDTALELQGLNYQHIGTKIYIDRSGAMEGKSDIWDGLRGQWEAFRNGVFWDFVDDHMVGNYVVAFHDMVKEAEEGFMEGIVDFFQGIFHLKSRSERALEKEKREEEEEEG